MLPALLLASALGATLPASGSGLLAAAAASGRPPECAPVARRAGRGPSVWAEARAPELTHYCDLLAHAEVALANDPSGAKRMASEADALWPGHASPSVILGRAALALGDASEAMRAFDRAASIDARSLEDPVTMHAHALALRDLGRRDQALAVFRALVPRVDLLAPSSRRVEVLLEAALLAMADEARPPAARADEAIAYLREARQRPGSPLAGDVLVALALALDRAGDRVQADATLADVRRGSARPLGARYLAAPEDGLALAALAAERFDAGAAAKQWEAFLGGHGGRGAWAAEAKARLERLRHGEAPAPKHGGGGGRHPRGIR